MLLIIFKELFKENEAIYELLMAVFYQLPTSIYWYLYNVFCLFSPHAHQRPLLLPLRGYLGAVTKQMHMAFISHGQFC